MIQNPNQPNLKDQVVRLKRQDKIFWIIGLLSLAFALVTLLSLMIDMAMTGWPRLSYLFFTSFVL